MHSSVCWQAVGGGGGGGMEHPHPQTCTHEHVHTHSPNVLYIHVCTYLPLQDSDKRHINLGLGPSGVHVVMGTVHVAVYDW